jgi:glucosamine-6-phosphate deaminase
MKIHVFPDSPALGRAAAEHAARILGDAIRKQGTARFIVATGASQFTFLGALTQLKTLDWAKTEMFHLDEYLGLRATHPASFRKYLVERLIRPAGITRYHFLDGEGMPAEVCRATGAALNATPIDVAFVGIGENGHLAFNDPPADFETEEPYVVVELDEACRRQQLGEGWFARLEDVPRRAMSMSIRQILKARQILCIVPDKRKANAVRACLTGEITPMVPASALRRHPDVTVYLDRDSASRLPAGPDKIGKSSTRRSRTLKCKCL